MVKGTIFRTPYILFILHKGDGSFGVGLYVFLVFGKRRHFFYYQGDFWSILIF